jgi:hypothetical protein
MEEDFPRLLLNISIWVVWKLSNFTLVSRTFY